MHAIHVGDEVQAVGGERGMVGERAQGGGAVGGQGGQLHDPGRGDMFYEKPPIERVFADHTIRVAGAGWNALADDPGKCRKRSLSGLQAPWCIFYSRRSGGVRSAEGVNRGAGRGSRRTGRSLGGNID
ncbi:hypothetical protein GCM10009555_043900 [Acrocarpospora macrocephala]|uniref:Uncharacterized protein n=1 Tax=Acrocarpospora macrocephala TaxID=150177 RepID=A0A5M3WD07_9ACTN|nr:hypothetical protein Amac_005420 [Acrocarpospora macrocephala]